MNNLDKKITETFEGCVVRKDLVKEVKGNAIVPSYVLEYLLGQDNYVVEESKKEYGITMSNEEIRIIEELRKHPKLYNRLIENPERMINSLDKR